MYPLSMVCNLQEVAVKPFAQFYTEIFMVLESPGSCREAMIDGLDSPGCCGDAIYKLFQMKYQRFWNKQEAAVNPLLMVWDLQEVAVKPFTNFSNEILMVFNSQEVAVKPFAHFSNEISMVLESAGGCCESIFNVLESPEGCCEGICTFCLGNINGF